MSVPHGDRSNVVIEPFLTDQWYVNAKELAKPAIAAVRDGKTKFIPKNWEKTYFDWMENIQPWCISRQLWWGHQIPAWYGPDGKVFVALTEAEAQAEADKHYGKKTTLTRDEDVLDTWFSSALWPFSTLGWPDETAELKRYYPTSTLVTGFDIIFFWVARMMMMGLHFMKEIPFHDVYIHALVRDASGAKMSKSKGNVIDPLALIDDYGADALRFTLAAMAAMGRDIKLSTQRVEGYRNFATKLWNAARFAEMNGCATVAKFDPKSAKETLNRWIAHETAKAAAEVTEAIEAYRFNDAAAAVYRFVWNIYCDWYLELAKPLLTGPDGAGKSETQAMVAWARDEILKLLHPFMPFVTEELWAVTGKHDALLALDKWPKLSGARRRQGRSRNRLGDRPRHRDPFGPRRDEHHGGDPAGARRRIRREQGARRALGRVHQAAGARVRHFVRGGRAEGLGAARGARGGGGTAAQGRHRSCRRARAARQGNAEGGRRHRARRCQAQQSELHGAGAGRGGRRGAGKARGSARAQGQDRRGAGPVEGRGLRPP